MHLKQLKLRYQKDVTFFAHLIKKYNYLLFTFAGLLVDYVLVVPFLMLSKKYVKKFSAKYAKKWQG